VFLVLIRTLAETTAGSVVGFSSSVLASVFIVPSIATASAEACRRQVVRLDPEVENLRFLIVGVRGGSNDGPQSDMDEDAESLGNG